MTSIDFRKIQVYTSKTVFFRFKVFMYLDLRNFIKFYILTVMLDL